MIWRLLLQCVDRLRHRAKAPVTATLHVGETLALLPSARPASITVVRGHLWVTQAGDHRDYLLKAGDQLKLDGSGLVVASCADGRPVCMTSEGLNQRHSGGGTHSPFQIARRRSSAAPPTAACHAG